MRVCSEILGCHEYIIVCAVILLLIYTDIVAKHDYLNVIVICHAEQVFVFY